MNTPCKVVAGLLCLGAILNTGCTSTHAHWSAVKLREQSAEYYEKQIMENLIRASRQMMFVHVDLGDLNAVVSTKLAGNVGGGQTLKNTGGPLADITREATRPFTFTISPDRTDSLTINTSPVLGNAAVYAPYIRFLNLASPQDPTKIGAPFDKDKETLAVRATIRSLLSNARGARPSEKAYVPGTLRKWDDEYYYIPAAYKRRYFELCLALMVRQGADTTKDGKGKGFLETQQETLLKELERTKDKVDEMKALQLRNL